MSKWIILAIFGAIILLAPIPHQEKGVMCPQSIGIKCDIPWYWGPSLFQRFFLGQKTPEPSHIQTVSTNTEVANWKVYTSQQYSFSFKYPNGWGIVGIETKCENFGDKKTALGLPSLGPEYLSGDCPTEGSTMSFWDDSKYLQELRKGYWRNVNFEKSIINVGGKDSEYLKGIYPADENYPAQEKIFVIVPLTSTELVIELNGFRHQKYFDQILSTLKFTN